MTRRLDRYARALPILAMAAAGALLSAQTLPGPAPATTPGPAPIPAPASESAAPSAVAIPATAPGVVPATLPAQVVTPASAVAAAGATPVIPAAATTQPSAPDLIPTTHPAPPQTDIKLPDATSRPAKLIKLEFKDAQLSTVVDYLSESLGFTIKKTAPIEGRISLVSRSPVTPEVALTLLDEALADKGLTAVQQGTILKIVAISDVKRQNLKVFVGNDPSEIAETADWITQVIPVKNIDAVKLRQDLQPLINGDADFTANQGSNTLILTDTSANIKRVVTIISKLDESTAKAAEVKIYRLKFANATSTAKLITSIFSPDASQNAQQGGPGGGGPGRMFRQMMMGGAGGGAGGGAAGADNGKNVGKVTATADDRTNTVVVVAPSETLKLIDKIVDELDADQTATSTIQTFQLKFADAPSAAKLINSVFQQEQQGQQQGFNPFGGFGRRLQGVQETDQGGKVTAAAADKSNTLVVTAPPALMKVIGEILNKLDADPAAMSQVNVFQLQFADSDSAAKLINSIFGNDQNGSSQQNQQRGASNFGFGGPGGGGQGGGRGGAGADASGASGNSAARVVVNAVSDERTNTVVVTAPSDAMRVITGILEKLDSNPSAQSALFIYHLKNGVAADIQQTLSSLFSTSTSGSTNSNTNRNNSTSGSSLSQSGLGSTSGFGGSSGGRSGSSGVGGSSSNFGQPLTSNTNTQRATGATGNTSQSGASIRATSELVGQVIVVADNDTNSLLVSTASKYREQVVKIIDELDRPVPQVLIKVLVAEVTHERTNDLGPDFSVLDTRASGKGLTAVQTLGNVASQTTNGGLAVSLVEDNLNATLHALATENKLDVLSRPYILATDNQPASITVGQEVPFITNTQLTDTGQQINTITYQAVGIILNVTPHINPDGAVTLDVNPEISDISATTVPIGNGISAPVIDNRSAQSRVTVRSGNTVVIGGMMQDNKTSTVTKVPLLGDIPYIGAAFSRIQTDVSKTELLIFLTPHVAPRPDLLPGMSRDEESSLTIMPNAVYPGAYQKHMTDMSRGATTQPNTTLPSSVNIDAPPSTQPFRGINISAEPPGVPAQGPAIPGK